MSKHDDQQRRADSASRVRRSAAEQQEADRTRAFEAIEATFPSIATATGDELVQMAVHALGFDAASLAASLGIARSQGETLIRSPGSLSRRERSLLAQYLEMGVCEPKAFARNRSIAARLRASIADADRQRDADASAADAVR
jgi:kynurenine formamidase